MRLSVRTAIVALLAISMCGALAAQSAQLAAADAKELATYRLTMETVKKVQTATRAMIAELRKDPKFQRQLKVEAEIEGLRKKDELTDAEQERLLALENEKEQLEEANELNLGSASSLDEMEASVKKSPVVAGALKEAGLSPREYGTFIMAMIQASMASGFKKAGMIKELPKDVNPENVKFVEEHEAELKAMQAEFEALSKGGGAP
jgi:hypothetical protein